MPTNIIANLRINTSSAYRDLDAFKARIGGKAFSQPLGRISGDAAEFSKSLQAAAARVTAFGATTGAIYAVSKAINGTAKATIEVNKQLVELNTFLGVSQITLDKFGKTLFNISRQTGTPFANVAEAAKEFARQGLSLEETSKRTRDALVLARVAGIGYGQAVNGITTAINSFNKEALDSTTIINKLIAVDTRFAVSAKDINEAFVRVGSAAEEAGISSNKLVAAVTAAQQVTGRGGAVIGNALKTIFTRIQRTEVVDQLKDIGVAVTDQSGKLLDGIEILKNYAAVTRNLSQTEKNRADELLGGVYQINQLQGLIKDLTSANSVYTNSLRAASNATDEASKKNDELNKSLSSRITALSNTALQVGADIGKAVLQPLLEVGISVSDTILKALSPELYTDQAEKTSKSIGDSLGKNIAKGVGQFLVLAGGPIAGALGASIAARLLSFSKGAIGSQLSQINAPFVRALEGKPFFSGDYQKQLNLQNQITEAVIKSGAASGMTIGNVRQEAQARRALLQYLRQENQELERKAVLSQQVTSYLTQRGVSSTTQVNRTRPQSQARDPRTGRFIASGYIPNFAMSMAAEEVSLAKNFGAKNPVPKLINATIKGKTQPVMVNSEEDVIPNFAGTGDTAIIPKYRKMKDIPRMSKGHVPNFAAANLKISKAQLANLLKTKQFQSITYKKSDGSVAKYNAAQHRVRRDKLVGASAPAGHKNWTEYDNATGTIVLHTSKQGEAEAKFRRFSIDGIQQLRSGGNTYDIYASGYIPNFAKVLLAAKYYDALKVGKAKAVKISKSGDITITGREVFGGIGFSSSRIGKGYASAVRSTMPTTSLERASREAGVTKSIIVPVVASGSVNDPIPQNLTTNEALLQQFLANHPNSKQVVSDLSSKGFNVKNILKSHSGQEIKRIIDILNSDKSNRSILTQSAQELKDPALVKFFAPGGVKARGPKGSYAFGSSIAFTQPSGKYAIKQPGRHKSYPILIAGKAGPQLSEPVNAEEIFPGISDRKNRMFFASAQSFGTRVLDTDNPDHLRILNRLGYSKQSLEQEGFFAGGRIPNFAGLSQSISREKQMTGLPASQIMAHFDSKGSPTAVTNRRDEPNGLKDVPNFAPKFPKLTADNIVSLNLLVNLLSGAVDSVVNVMAQNETISPTVARNVSLATSAITALAGGIVGNKYLKSLGKKPTFGQQATAYGLPIGTGLATGAAGFFGSKMLEKSISQQKIQKESERVAQQFSDLTNNTQELSDTLAKLDTAYKDVSTNPEDLLKLTKRSTELTTKISKTNPELAAQLAAEPNVGRRIDLIQESNKKAASQQAVDQELLKLRAQGKASNQELASSFNRLIGNVGEDIFKTKQGSVSEANLPEFLKKNNLAGLSKFFEEQNQDVQTKLRPAFIKALNAQLKLNNEAEKYNKDITAVQGNLFKIRSKNNASRLLRETDLAGRKANLESLQDFAQNFGSRAAISAKADIFKSIESEKPINQFRQALNAKIIDEKLGLPKSVKDKLSSIESPGDIAKKQLEEASKTATLNEEQKEAIQKLITQNDTSANELKKISNISEINKNNQLRLLNIQESLSFGGGIKSSIDAKSRVESINAPLRGALEYQIGAQLGSPRSMIAGQTNFLKSIQGLYPGLIDNTQGIAMTSQRLSALRMGDLRLDLMRNAATAGRMGMPDVAAEFMKKASDPKALAQIAKNQTESELQSGKTPTDIANELKSTFEAFNRSLIETFAENARVREEERRIGPQQAEITSNFETFKNNLTEGIEEAFKQAFGPDGVDFKNSTIQAPNSTVVVTGSPSSGGQESKSGGFVPSFYNPLRKAIQRENKYVPLSSIRVNKSDKLVNSNNPFGLAVTNTFDEPNGLASIGLASRGFVPNFAAFGSKAASEARNNAKLGKLYVWDNTDNGFRKVNPSGTVDANLIDPKDLPKGARTISTELSKGGGKKSIIPLKDPKITKLDELSLPGTARSQSIDKVLSRLDRQGRLTPKNLLAEINKLSGGKDVLIKTAFGESNVQSKGVYGLGGKLSYAEARSIIGKYTRGTGSGFFIQEKVPTYYDELRVHVVVDDKGNVKIIKGGTVSKATGFNPSSEPYIKAYMDAGLSKSEAVKMTRSFRKSAEASAFHAVRAAVKTKGIKNASFGVDVGATTLQSALDAGVKSREFYSGGRGRVGTIVYEINPSDRTGSSGFMGRGLVEKLVKNIFGQKPAHPIPSRVAGIQNIAAKTSGLASGAKYGGASIGLGFAGLNSIFGSQPTPKAGGLRTFDGGAAGIASVLLTGAQMAEEIKNKQYGNAAVSAAQAGLYAKSIFSKAAPLSKILGKGAFGIAGNTFGYASALGFAKDIVTAKNFQVASDYSDILFGKDGGIGDLIGLALTARSGPVGAGVATAIVGYRVGNIIENKLRLGERLGNVIAGSEATKRAESASIGIESAFGMPKSISKQQVIEGKESASKYIESKRRGLEELSKAGAFKGDVIDRLNKDLDQIRNARKEREKAAEEKSRADAIIAKRAEETRAREESFKAEDNKRKEDQSKFNASLRRIIVEGVIKNEELSGLQTSRDKSLYLLEQEKIFGKFSESDFGENKGLYNSYKYYSNPEAAGGPAYRTQSFREEQQRKFKELASFPKDAFEEAVRRRVAVERVMEERKKGATKNKFNGFIPNFAYRRERSSVLTSPDYVGYRNAVPEPSKYYKNVVKNTAEIEVPAVEVYNRMGFFGAQPKNVSEKYAILNPAQQNQLGYAANGFVPNFAPEQFASAISEALQQALSPMMEKVGSSVSNSNVINVHDQRSFDVTSEKVNGVMEFLQKQFPTQFARQMGPNKV